MKCFNLIIVVKKRQAIIMCWSIIEIFEYPKKKDSPSWLECLVAKRYVDKLDKKIIHANTLNIDFWQKYHCMRSILSKIMFGQRILQKACGDDGQVVRKRWKIILVNFVWSMDRHLTFCNCSFNTSQCAALTFLISKFWILIAVYIYRN